MTDRPGGGQRADRDHDGRTVGEDNTTEYVPPSNQTETVATSETVLVGGEEIPIAQPGDTTAAAVAVPPGGPGGVVTVAEFECEPPFCAERRTNRTCRPRRRPPIDNRVIQFVPPSAPYYDYQNPVTYSIVYDATVVARRQGRRSVTALYTKDSEPEHALPGCEVPDEACRSTAFPCLKSRKVLKGRTGSSRVTSSWCCSAPTTTRRSPASGKGHRKRYPLHAELLRQGRGWRRRGRCAVRGRGRPACVSMTTDLEHLVVSDGALASRDQGIDAGCR